MSKLNFFFRRYARWLFASAYAGTAVIFLAVCAQFYLPDKGFTYTVMFGDRMNPRYLPELQSTPHFELPDSYGYDAQYYAQIAMRPRLTDTELQQAVDNLPYRARRILFSVIPYALAGGDAVAALHIFAVQNIVCWVLLGILLLRWFPPGTPDNFVRWAGVMLSFGLCFSVRGALVDGPSLLLIAVGMALLEMGRPWVSATVLGIAGLAKETNILAGAAFAVPERNDVRGWGLTILRGALVLLPLAAWVICLKLWLGSGGDAGARNFALPFAGFVEKWGETFAQLRADGFKSFARWNLFVLVALTVQFLFFAVRPNWRNPWWRIAAAYSLLMVMLGQAVWEGYPGAASRVLLPMALAFNILVPRGRWWWLVLVLGNLAVIPSADVMNPPGRDGYRIAGTRELRVANSSGKAMEVIFNEHWYAPEKSHFEYWRWSDGGGVVTIRNPHAETLVVDVEFVLRAAGVRTVTVRHGETIWWHGELRAGQPETVELLALRLPPGDTVVHFETDQPAVPASAEDLRRIAFNVRNLKIRLRALEKDPRSENGR